VAIFFVHKELPSTPLLPILTLSIIPFPISYLQLDLSPVAAGGFACSVQATKNRETDKSNFKKAMIAKLEKEGT
jgi:hypothetical protein